MSYHKNFKNRFTFSEACARIVSIENKR